MLNEKEVRELYVKYAEDFGKELIAVEHNEYSSNFAIVKGYWKERKCYMYNLCYIDFFQEIQVIRSYSTVTDAFKAFAALVQNISKITTYPF